MANKRLTCAVISNQWTPRRLALDCGAPEYENSSVFLFNENYWLLLQGRSILEEWKCDEDRNNRVTAAPRLCQTRADSIKS